MPSPSFDLKALTGNIPGVDSYRTSTSVGGVKQFETVVVTKPVLSKAITVYDDSGNISNRYIIIGTDAWTADSATGAFQGPESSSLVGTMLMAFDPAMMLGAYAQLDFSKIAQDQGSEQKNGIQARHVRLDSTSFLGAPGPCRPDRRSTSGSRTPGTSWPGR